MYRAFIFDLDGVLIDDEQIWENEKQKMYVRLFGNEVTKRLGSTLGVNMDAIYERALEAGAKVNRAKLIKTFYELADTIYNTAPITEGLDELVTSLKELDYSVGIVSASPLPWITAVTKRLSFENDIEVIISLHERNDLSHKPAPDGYLEAIKIMNASPETTIILEDSNSGIKSAKASNSFTVGLRQNLVNGYAQEGADAYANNMKEVMELVRQYTKTSQNA